jgi:hypothetical protein
VNQAKLMLDQKMELGENISLSQNVQICASLCLQLIPFEQVFHSHVRRVVTQFTGNVEYSRQQLHKRLQLQLISDIQLMQSSVVMPKQISSECIGSVDGFAFVSC